LLDKAGLREIQVRMQQLHTGGEAKGILGRYGWHGMMGVFGRILGLYLRNPHYRAFVKRVRQDAPVPENL